MIVDYSEEESEKIKEMLQNEYEVFVAKQGYRRLDICRIRKSRI